MSIEMLNFAEPFFTVRHISGESAYTVDGSTILLNLADVAVDIERQQLASLQSCIVTSGTIKNIERAVLIERFDRYTDQDALFRDVKKHWLSAFEKRGEERLRGVEHYMSPKVFVDNVGLTMYHSGSVPLNVGLHRDHPFCPVPGFREVHTQVVGFGKMQQCRERDIATLYLEEPMAPGATHRPMYDEHGNYPWHQYETITPAIFMAVEILPPGVDTSALIQ
jgi:hypothetical protein